MCGFNRKRWNYFIWLNNGIFTMIISTYKYVRLHWRDYRTLGHTQNEKFLAGPTNFCNFSRRNTCRDPLRQKCRPALQSAWNLFSTGWGDDLCRGFVWWSHQIYPGMGWEILDIHKWTHRFTDAINNYRQFSSVSNSGEKPDSTTGRRLYRLRRGCDPDCHGVCAMGQTSTASVCYTRILATSNVLRLGCHTVLVRSYLLWKQLERKMLTRKSI